MLKNRIFILVVSLLLSSNLFAQNDNNLIPKEETFFIQSAVSFGRNNSGFWDLPGEKDFAIGDQISVWAHKPEKKDPRHRFGLTNGADRKYKIYSSKNSEYVRIRLAEIKGFVDVVGSKNGTNIQMYGENNKSSQNFRFKYMNNGKFKIYNENGKILKLEKKTSANGTKIVLWNDWNGPHTEWVL
nr:RICIN domain-containing protein [Melioribacteraceae bacterium]